MENNFTENTIRVSAAGLVRIELGGKYLVEINKNRQDVLTPIGGALEFHEEARLFLASLGAKFEKGMDIRLGLPAHAEPAFAEWFHQREGRETSPLRELREELLEEHQLAIAPELLAACEARYLWLAQSREPTSRRGQEGLLTSYYLEIFKIIPSPELALSLLAAVPQAPRLRLVTGDEVQQGQAATDSMKIASSVTSLLSTHPQPDRFEINRERGHESR